MEHTGPADVRKVAMSVDVEDYFQVAAFRHVISPEEWHRWKPRVEDNTRQLLDLFERMDYKATFFVLGWVAERHPGIVKDIIRRGHELASHGYSHQLIYEQTPQQFRRETERARKLLQDISGHPVKGYRAASYSITPASLWALDILVETGFSWDSSIFPIRHDTYGMAGSPRGPYRLITPNGAQLTEFPLTTAKVMGLPLPAAGGGYFRQYPYWLSRWLLRRAMRNGPAVFYLHPWEIDPQQPRVREIGWKSRFRHYSNLSRCLPRLGQLCHDFAFAPVGEVLTALPSLPSYKLPSYKPVGRA